MRLTTENLIVGYGKGPIVNGVDVVIPEGKITALLGPNGCGKSTLLKTLSRILHAESGQVLWQGKPIEQVSVAFVGAATGAVATIAGAAGRGECARGGGVWSQPVHRILGPTV